MKLIPLSKGGYTLVSDKDYAYLSKFKWYMDTSTGYVRRSDYSGSKKRTVFMHRIIRGGDMVDHRNQNRLDNRRCNLRSCIKSQNMRNRGRQVNNTSGFKGVSLWKARKKWSAKIQVDGRTINLGLFVDPIQAAKAYDKAAKKHFGRFAVTNF